MSQQKRIEDFGIKIGEMPKGKLNKITDVKGIRVGHYTIDNNENKTGVTVVMPSEGNIFTNRLVAACHVLNGYGKTAGLVQIEELGTIESPIALTNTLNVGLVHDAIVEHMINECKRDNVELKSFNPIICECNDSGLNNIQNRAVKKEHVFDAIKNSSKDFKEGDVGGGKGMVCHSLKGGIGSASRLVELDGNTYTLGVLVQSNHGLVKDLTINGKRLGEKIEREVKDKTKVDKGSIIMIIATDIPLSDRQLKRSIKRASVGLARLGSYIGHGSGEIMIGFSTANVIKKGEEKDITSMNILNEAKIDKVFRAVAESCEEAVLNSMITAKEVIGYSGAAKLSLKDFIDRI